MSFLWPHHLRWAALFLVFWMPAFELSGVASSACAQTTDSAQPKVSDRPLNDEQLAVYQAVLSRWMSGGKQPLNLAVETDAFPMDGAHDATDCLKGLDLEVAPDNVVHRFRTEDLVQLKPANLRLVDPEAQQKEVDENDPGKAIRQGKSIDSALKNGFAHGLVWFSEIRFDKSHTHAVVFYGFHCGSLCGNGGTEILEKRNGVWKFKSQCSIWMS
jgi:hypothetical protein